MSELAAVEHGQYVVRVLVQNDGVTLASGLAAATSVEQAEDQARTRALGLLTVGGTQAAPKSPPVQSAIASAPIPVPSPTSVPIKAPTATKPVPAAAPATDFKFDLPLSTPPEPEPEPVIEEASPVAPAPVEETLDFSDIIARSDVELKRLGWTSEQGRNYLLETYGKRSRQLLSDAELLEFLRFLESQPSP